MRGDVVLVLDALANETDWKDEEDELLEKGLTEKERRERKKKPWRSKKGKRKMKTIFKEWKNRSLHQGRSSKKVTDHKQAIAIALSMGRRAMRKSLPNAETDMDGGPALVLELDDLEKAIPSFKPGGPGRVYDTSSGDVAVQPSNTAPGRVFSGAPRDRSANGGPPGRITPNGTQRRTPDALSGRVYSESYIASQDESEDPKEPDAVVRSEEEYDPDEEDSIMRSFGIDVNRQADGHWSDPTAAASNAIHFHYDPTEREFHFTATARDGSPMASIARRKGKSYLMMKSMGGIDGTGLLGQPPGAFLSGPEIRETMKKILTRDDEPMKKSLTDQPPETDSYWKQPIVKPL